MKPQASKAFAAFIGLDWADAKHDVCLQAAGTEQREFRSLAHNALRAGSIVDFCYGHAIWLPVGYQFPIYRVANDCLTAPIAFFTWVGNIYRLPILQWRADAVEPVALPYGP